MNQNDCYKLIFRSKIFSIPGDFPLLFDVDQKIYNTLITTKRYEVKTNVNELVFQSFIDNWVKQKVPNIDVDNLPEYENLSKEFDRMKNLIQIFKRNRPKYKKSFEIKQITDRRKKNQELRTKMIQKTQKFMKIICYSKKYKEKILKESNYHEFVYFQRELDSFHHYISNIDKEIDDFVEDTILEFLQEIDSEKDKVEINDIVYKINNNDRTACIFNGSMAKGDVLIPRTINYKTKQFTVTSIAKNAFKSSYIIRSINFAENSEIRTISKGAFSYSLIQSISIPKKVTTIEDKAFLNCFYLKQITFEPNSEINYIGKEAFTNASIEKVFISSESLQIGKEAFSNSRLKEAEFPHIYSIDMLAFKCTQIEKIKIPSNIVGLTNGWLHGIESIPFIEIIKKDVENITFYGEKNDFIIGKCDPFCQNFDILLFARKDIKYAAIPSFIKRIGHSAFENCMKLENVIFTEDSELISIEPFAFHHSSLKNIIIPKHVTIIGEEAFSNCIQLNSCIFSDDSELQIIGKSAFYRSSIKEITIPSSLKQICSFAFYCTTFTNINIPKESQLRIIEKGAFSNSKVDILSLPSTIIDLPKFCSCSPNLNKVVINGENEQFMTIDDDQILIGKSDVLSDNYDVLLFASRNIKIARIPSFIKTIAEHSFEDCKSLKRVKILADSQLISIKEFAFADSSISKIILPSSLTRIEEYAFFECDNLSICKIENFQNSHLKVIGSYSFFNCVILSLFIFPSSLRKIGVSAFQNSNLKYALFPENSQLTEICDNAFSNSPLKEIFLPASLLIIGSCAFENCHYIEIFRFAEKSNLQIIKESAFILSSLKSIIIPSHVSKICENAFCNCSNLLIVEINENSELELFSNDIFHVSNNASLMKPNKS